MSPIIIFFKSAEWNFLTSFFMLSSLVVSPWLPTLNIIETATQWVQIHHYNNVTTHQATQWVQIHHYNNVITHQAIQWVQIHHYNNVITHQATQHTTGDMKPINTLTCWPSTTSDVWSGWTVPPGSACKGLGCQHTWSVQLCKDHTQFMNNILPLYTGVNYESSEKY